MKSGSRSGTSAATAIAQGPTWLWTCSGICFGYSSGNSLYTHDGLEVGRFAGPEIYGPDGRYLGELSNADLGGRLITNTYKKSRTRPAFVPGTSRPYALPDARPARPVYSGHEDFPPPGAVIARSSSVSSRAKRIFRDSLGQDLLEYALAVAFVAVAAGALMPNVATSISTIFSKVTSVVTAAGN